MNGNHNRDQEALGVATSRKSWYVRHGKRILDLGLGGLILLSTIPLQLLLALLIRARLGPPVLFRQQRPGKNGELFTMFKFRTMANHWQGDGTPRPDADRLTPLGRWLRSFSLDELPELFNVVRGEMSLVGPRPLLVEYLPRYSVEERRRHEVAPGVTGLAQVNGRNLSSWESKFKYDVLYVDQVSFKMDILILVKTVGSVLTRRGITAEGHATAPEFLAHSNRAYPSSTSKKSGDVQ